MRRPLRSPNFPLSSLAKSRDDRNSPMREAVNPVDMPAMLYIETDRSIRKPATNAPP
jgi:hypothetical protein